MDRAISSTTHMFENTPFTHLERPTKLLVSTVLTGLHLLFILTKLFMQQDFLPQVREHQG